MKPSAGKTRIGAPATLGAVAFAIMGAALLTKPHAQTARPTATPALSSWTLSGTDSALNLGSPATNDYPAPGSEDAEPTITRFSDSSDRLSPYYPNPYDTTSGGGTIDVAYTGIGGFTRTINLNALDADVLNGYRNIQYGPSIFSGGSDVEGQAPQFPVQLNTLSSLFVDTTYSLSDFITSPHNIDVLYRELPHAEASLLTGTLRSTFTDLQAGNATSEEAMIARGQGSDQFTRLGVAAANCPQSAIINPRLVTMDCRQNDSAVDQFQFGNVLHIGSGTGTFSEISATSKFIRVAPNEPLAGTVTLRAHNGFPPDAVAPLIWTPSWGPHKTSWRLIHGWIPVGDSSDTASINVNAPQQAGPYFIAFAFDGELSGDQVASATNWARRKDTWNDCNDDAELTPIQVAEAQRCGFTVNQRLYSAGYRPSYLAADVIIVHVEGGGVTCLCRTPPCRTQAWTNRCKRGCMVRQTQSIRTGKWSYKHAAAASTESMRLATHSSNCAANCI